MAEGLAKHLRVKRDTQTTWVTAAGTLSTSKKCKVYFTLPELSTSMAVVTEVHFTKNLSKYDLILGRDLMTELKLKLDFEDNVISCKHISIPMRNFTEMNSNEANFVTGIKEPESVTEATDWVRRILDAKYRPYTPSEITEKCGHLNAEEKDALKMLLTKYADLFDGTLGKWRNMEYHIELKDKNCSPVSRRAYPVPKVSEKTLLLEIERLCKIGVLKKVNCSEWGAPSMIIPKKDGTVCFISDFRELNKLIRRKPFLIPKIQDLQLNLEGFMYGTTLDLNMGYYHIELSPASKRLCTIVFPFGKYKYQRLPMGLCNSPDIFQECMSELFIGLDFVRTYLDDIACLSSDTWQDHLNKLDIVFRRLQEAGLKVNADKSFFGLGELEYLGYIITRDSIKPQPKKVQGILNISPPKTVKQLRSFLGCVNYYRDMWIWRSHILAPLNKLLSKESKWQWTELEKKAFDDIKKVMARETLLVYPDFNKTFEIHTDASRRQIGSVITQDNKPIAFYSRKLRGGQHNYTVTELELLAMVETLKEFRTILFGQKL